MASCGGSVTYLKFHRCGVYMRGGGFWRTHKVGEAESLSSVSRGGSAEMPRFVCTETGATLGTAWVASTIEVNVIRWQAMTLAAPSLEGRTSGYDAGGAHRVG